MFVRTRLDGGLNGGSKNKGGRSRPVKHCILIFDLGADRPISPRKRHFRQKSRKAHKCSPQAATPLRESSKKTANAIFCGRIRPIIAISAATACKYNLTMAGKIAGIAGLTSKNPTSRTR